MEKQLKPLSTPTELAEYLGFSKAHLARLRCQGGGPQFIKLGVGGQAAIRYRREDIVDFIESRVRQNTSQEKEVVQ